MKYTQQRMVSLMIRTTTKSQYKMQGRLLLDVVVRKGTAILQLLAGEDQTLLIWGDSLLVLDLRLHILDGVRWLDLECDGLAGERFHENLHFAESIEQHSGISTVGARVARESEVMVLVVSGARVHYSFASVSDQISEYR